MAQENIHDLLKNIQTLWDESLNGDYKNQGRLKSLAIKVKEMNCSNYFINSSLSTTERTTYANAMLLANYNKK